MRLEKVLRFAIKLKNKTKQNKCDLLYHLNIKKGGYVKMMTPPP